MRAPITAFSVLTTMALLATSVAARAEPVPAADPAALYDELATILFQSAKPTKLRIKIEGCAKAKPSDYVASMSDGRVETQTEYRGDVIWTDAGMNGQGLYKRYLDSASKEEGQINGRSVTSYEFHSRGQYGKTTHTIVIDLETQLPVTFIMSDRYINFDPFHHIRYMDGEYVKFTKHYCIGGVATRAESRL